MVSVKQELRCWVVFFRVNRTPQKLCPWLLIAFSLDSFWLLKRRNFQTPNINELIQATSRGICLGENNLDDPEGQIKWNKKRKVLGFFLCFLTTDNSDFEDRFFFSLHSTSATSETKPTTFTVPSPPHYCQAAHISEFLEWVANFYTL